MAVDMLAPHRVALALLLCAPVISAVTVRGAAADEETQPAARAKGRREASKATAASEFKETCVQANARYVSHDTAGAIELYRKAISLQPRNPLGHYLLGEALLGSGNPAEAEASWLQADQVAENGPASVKAKILFVLADLRDRAKKWDEAKLAWQKYVDFCSKHSEIGAFPASGTARIQAIDEMLKQDKAYEIVRQRIKEEKEHGPGLNQ